MGLVERSLGRWKCTIDGNDAQIKISWIWNILYKRGKTFTTLAKSASLKSSLESSILCNLCFTLQRKSSYCTREYYHLSQLEDYSATSLMIKPDPALVRCIKTRKFDRSFLHTSMSVCDLSISQIKTTMITTELCTKVWIPHQIQLLLTIEINEYSVSPRWTIKDNSVSPVL